MSSDEQRADPGEGSSEADFPTRLTQAPPTPATNPAFAPTVTTGALGSDRASDSGRPPITPHGDTAVADNKLGHYRLEKRLGVGGMGEVYLGTDIHLERPAAIKVIRRDFAEVPGALDRLKTEAQAAARLHHPNIVSVYQFGEENGRYYIAFEYVPGRDLARVIQEDGPMEPVRALRVIRQAAAALRYASENKIIHRDIKPSNLILLAGDVVKVADFGLAKRLDADTKLTKTDMVVGSPSYMSPEQGLGKTLDFRADIYSLGCTLFALLMGEAPYSASTPLAVMMHHANSAIPEPDKLKKAMDGRLVVLLKKMLAKRALERHTSYEQLLKELDELIGGAGGARPWAWRSRVLHGVLPGLVLLGIGLGIAWGVGQRLRTRPQPAPPPPARTTAATAAVSAPPPTPVAQPPAATPAPAEVAAALADDPNPVADRVLEGELIEAASVMRRARDMGRLVHEGLWDEALGLKKTLAATPDLSPRDRAMLERLEVCVEGARRGEQRMYEVMREQVPFELSFFAGPVRFVAVDGEKILYEAPPGSDVREGTFLRLERPDRHLLSESVYRQTDTLTVDEAFAKALFLFSVAPHTGDQYFDQAAALPGFDAHREELTKSWRLWTNLVRLGTVPLGPASMTGANGQSQGNRPGPGGGLRPLRRNNQPLPPRRQQ